MGLFKSAKGSVISENFVLLEDVGQLKKDLVVEVVLYDEHLELTAPFMKKTPISLKYAQITDVFYGMQTEIVTKSKSPIGRAVAGGLLFGGAGAVIGAISGTGKKEKKVNKFYFVVSYTSSAGEDKLLQFEDTRLYKGRKLAAKLKELCGLPDEFAEDVTEL